MRVHASRLLSLIVVLSLATSVLAFTVSELLDRATTLDSGYTSLLGRTDNCPGGTCSDRSAIESDFAAAEADRTALKADRATLTNCTTCSTLDQAISVIDGKAGTIQGRIDGWDGQS